MHKYQHIPTSSGLPELLVAPGKPIRSPGQILDTQFVYEECSAKCTTQLLLTKLVAELVEKFFDKLGSEHTSILLQSLESQYKFAKEFNSEATLRFRLWKAGFQSSKDELPGLLSQEEESLKVSLTIQFKLYFNSPQQDSNKLFAHCSKVLKDYVLKHSELVSVTSVKGQHKATLKGLNEDQLSLYHKTDLERQLDHQSPIVHSVILENFLKLEDGALNANMRDLGQLLIDLTLCSDHTVRSKNHKLLTRMFDYLQQK